MPEQLASSAEPSGAERSGPPAPMLIEEAEAISEANPETPLLSTSLMLAAWRGQETRASELIEAGIQDATSLGEGGAIALAGYARAVLYNGLSRYRAAAVAAQQTCAQEDLHLVDRALPELIEASVHGGSLTVAAAALRRLDGRLGADSPEWALGVQAQSRALLSTRTDAEALYREAIVRLRSSGTTLQLARAQLVYGEWLRRDRRRVDARAQLRAALGAFGQTGAEGFAQRAQRELRATGASARRRSVETRDDLTEQETQIARQAGAGFTNSEIGTEMFISPRTVEWHLRKVFIKLDISSRRQLRDKLLARRVGASA